MKQKKLSELTDEELLQQARKLKTAALTNAVLIGFLIGVVFYSAVNNSLGFLTLIPLFLAYKLINNSKYDRTELQQQLKQRNLK